MFIYFLSNLLMGGSPVGAAGGVALSGPTIGLVNTPSSNFTVTPDALYTGTITPADAGSGGTFTPTSLAYVSSSAPQTFTYTASAVATIPISITASPGLTITGSPIEYSVSAIPGGLVSYVDPTQVQVIF